MHSFWFRGDLSNRERVAVISQKVPQHCAHHFFLAAYVYFSSFSFVKVLPPALRPTEGQSWQVSLLLAEGSSHNLPKVTATLIAGVKQAAEDDAHVPLKFIV